MHKNDGLSLDIIYVHSFRVINNYIRLVLESERNIMKKPLFLYIELLLEIKTRNTRTI